MGLPVPRVSSLASTCGYSALSQVDGAVTPVTVDILNALRFSQPPPLSGPASEGVVTDAEVLAPPWWTAVETLSSSSEQSQYEKQLGVVQTICSGCADFGRGKERVLCTCCRRVYCTYHPGKSTGCVGVPPFALKWLCVSCRNSSDLPLRYRDMAGSKMNTQYDHRAYKKPEISQNRDLSSLLIIELADNSVRPQIGQQILKMFRDGFYAERQDITYLCEIDLNTPRRKSMAGDSSLLQFIERHKSTLSVLIIVRAHSVDPEGLITEGPRATQICELLFNIISPKVWAAISRLSRARLLLPLVCGHVYRTRESFQSLCTLIQPECTHGGWSDFPPLVTDIVGFTTTNFLLAKVASNIGAFLQSWLVFQHDILSCMKDELGSCGIIVHGRSTDCQAPAIWNALTRWGKDSKRDSLWGLPLPPCPDCGRRCTIKIKTRRNGWADKIRLECLKCRLRTKETLGKPEFGPESRNDWYIWPFPFAEQRFTWVRSDMRLVDRGLIPQKLRSLPVAEYLA